jgi:hypothetical protein
MAIAFGDYLYGTITVARALLTGKDVGEDRLRRRLEICAGCDKVKFTDNDGVKIMRCGICGCKLKEKGLVNLARFEEVNGYGCKHPVGSKWRAAGV